MYKVNFYLLGGKDREMLIKCSRRKNESNAQMKIWAFLFKLEKILRSSLFSKKLLFKSVSLLVAAAFLWQQIVFAADLGAGLSGDPVDRLNDSQTQTFAPDYVQDQKVIHEDLVNLKQEIEDSQSSFTAEAASASSDSADSDAEGLDLKGPVAGYSESGQVMQAASAAAGDANLNIEEGGVISITTATGDTIRYKDGVVFSIDTKDGARLKDVVLDDAGNLLAAEITYADGTIQIVSGGKVIKITKPDGTVFNYNSEERLLSVLYPGGRTESYTYIKDAANALLEIVVSDGEKTAYYTPDGVIKKTVFAAGRTIEYESGRLSKITEEDGRIYIYNSTETDPGEYVAELAEIYYLGNRYIVEDNDVVRIVLSDGTTLTDFELDDNGSIISARIEYADGVTAVFNDRRLAEIVYPDGRTARYAYSEDALSCVLTINDGGVISEYRFTKDSLGRLTIDEAGRVYEYDAAGRLAAFRDEASSSRHLYNGDGSYAGSIITLTDGTIKEYGADRKLIRTVLPDGTIYEYYTSGEFSGKLQKISFADGKSILYEYAFSETLSIDVRKRVSYNNAYVYQNYSSTSMLSYLQNPSLKAEFNLASGTNSYLSTRCYYSQSGNKYVYLYVDIIGGRARIYYYNYDYKTAQRVYDNKFLDIPIRVGTVYTIEYVWTPSGINIYLYESSGSRPSQPAYTISDNCWDPRFSIIANRANLNLDPSSTGTYSIYGYSSVSSSNPLGANPVYTTEFKFRNNASSKYFYYYMRGSTSQAYDYIYLIYNASASYLMVYHYDYLTYKSSYRTVPISGIDPSSGKTYAVQLRMEDSKLSLFINEKGSLASQPVVTIENVSWSPQISANISGGDLSVQGYDNLEILDYDETDQVMNDPYAVLPDRFFAGEAVKMVPDGAIDALTGRVFDLALSVSLPESVFGHDGKMDAGALPDGDARFNIMRYSADGKLKQLIRPSGETVNYTDGLISEVRDKDGALVNSYDYTVSGSGDILGIISNDLQSDLVKEYDVSGSLVRLSAGGVNMTLRNNLISSIKKDDGTIMEDVAFDEAGSVITAKITKPDGVVAFYSGGVLRQIIYPDGSAIYYDEAGQILRSVTRDGVNYDYIRGQAASGAFTLAQASDPNSIENEDEAISRKYDDKDRIIQAILKSGVTMDYSYTEDASGNILSTIMNDGTTVTTYDKDNNILKTEVLPTADDPSSTISEYEYGRIRRVYKADELIYRYSYEFDPNGVEVTVVNDVKTGDFKRYKGGMLISVVDKNSLLTTYEYGADSKISGSTVTRYGKFIDSYIYTYDGDLTIMEDTAGVKRSYDADNKLKFLEEGGRTYAYSYSADASGGEVVNQELIRIRSEDGVATNYAAGHMESIVRPDGMVLSDFTIEDGKVTAYTIGKDSVKYYVADDRITRQERPDGTIIEYYANGWTKSVTSASGQTTVYDYEFLKSADIASDGTFEGVEIPHGVEALRLREAPDPLQALLLHFDGADGQTSSGDSSGYANTVIFNGNAHIEGADPRFGSGALVLDGSGDYVTIPKTGNFNYGTDDFTIDFWLNLDTLPSNDYAFVFQGSNGSKYFELKIVWTGGVACIDTSSAIFGSQPSGIVPNQWYHIALVRSGNTATIYKDGAAIAVSDDISGADWGDFSSDLIIGAVHASGFSDGHFLDGRMDEIRVTKGVARWMGNFTPPDSPYRDLIYDKTGTFVSRPIELGATEYLDLSWDNILPSGAGVTIQARTGDSSDIEDGTWGSWSEPMTDPSGSVVSSAAKKFIQFRINLSTADEACSPEISISGGALADIKYLARDEFSDDAPAYITTDPAGTAARNRYDPADAGQSSLKFGTDMIEDASDEIERSMLSGDSIIRTQSFKAELVDEIALSDGTVIKYFNNKPVSILFSDGTRIDNIVLERVNSAIYDYAVENGELIGYQDTGADAFIVDFTAKVPDGKTYIFKGNELAEVTLADGTVISAPARDETASGMFEAVMRAFVPEDLEGTKKIETSNISLSITKDGKITYYINNKMASTYHRYDDGTLELLADYSYDEAGNLVLVRLPYARGALDNQASSARQQIAVERAEYLQKLAQQKGIATSQVEAQVKAVRDQIAAERARLQPMLYQEVTRVSQGCWGAQTYTETVEVPEVRNALNQLDEQERLLNEEASSAYSELDSEIAAAEARLRSDEASSLAEVAAQEEIFRKQIVEEESTPVILEYYRAILGRDPDDVETKYWLDKIDYNSKIDVNALRDELTNSPDNSEERLAQGSFIAQLKTAIKEYLAGYLNADDAQRSGLLASLGLEASDIAALSQDEVDAIAAFLDRQNIHFGRSAFVSLETILKDSGITYELKDVALKAVLIDIFTGTINALSEGDLLELSVYALSKTASLYGLTLYNAKLDFESLKEIFTAGGKTIAHLNNNHFVVVTDISDDGKISYIEHNRGRAGYTWTVSREEFESAWTGYSISRAAPSDSTKILTAEEAQRIRGSCLPFIGVLIGLFVNTVAAIAAGVVTAIGYVVGAISAILGPIISGIGMVIKGITEVMIGVGKFLFGAIKFVGASLLKGVSGFFGGTLLGGGAITAGGSSGFVLGPLGLSIAKTVVSVALSVGVSKGLEALGVNSLASNLIGSFVTGGVSNLFNVFTPFGFVAGGLQALAVQGAGELGRHLGLDPNLTNVLSLASGALVGSALNNLTVTGELDFVKFSESFRTQIVPNVAGELAYYGISKAGEALGVDPRISYLAGVGIRSTINAGLTHDFKPDVIWGSVQNGLLSGIASVALEWAYQSLDLSPLLGSIAASTIGATLEALLNHQNPLVNIGNRAGEYLMDLGTFGMYDPQTGKLKIDPWSQAVYISKVLDFSRIIRDADDPAQGLVTALETYSSAIFHQQAIESIVKEGGILAMVTGRAEIKIDPETGKEKKRLWTSYQKKYYADIDMETGNLIEKFEPIDGVDVLIKQRYGVGADGKPIVDGRTVTETFKGGFTRTTSYDAKGNLISIITIQSGNEYELAQYKGELALDVNGNPFRGVLIDKQTGQKTYFDGYDVKIENPYDQFGINIGADTLLSPLYFNPALDTGETATRLDKISDMESDITNTSSNLYSSAFTDMISKAQQYAASDGSLDLSTFGDYAYWSSFGDLAGYYDNWSADIINLFSPVSIDETSTYEDIINSVEDSGKIDDLKTKTQEMNIFFEFANQMALKAKGVITEVSPTMFNLVKGLSMWTTDAYAFDGIMNNAKAENISFLDKAYNFITDAGSLISDKADILKETFWSGIKSGVNNVSSYFTTLGNFASSVYDLAQGRAEISLDTLKSLGTSAWQNIKTTAGEMKDLATYFKYMGSLALTNPDLPFAQGALLSLIGGDANAWSSLQDAADSAFNIANSLYDISSAFLDNTIDYATDVKDDIVNSTWWNTLKYSIIYNVDSVKDGFGYVTDKAIDLLTTSKDVFLGKVEVASQAAIYGQQKLMESFVELGKNMGLQAYEFWTNPNTISAIKNTSSSILNEIVGTIDNIDPMQKAIEFFGLVDPAPRIETSSIVLKTAYVDQKLNWSPFYNSVPLSALDLVTGLKFGNMRWDAANKSAAPYYENFVLQGMNGLSLSGINDNGVNLDRLVQMLVPYISGSFTITHSAGIGVLLNSSLTTDKVMIISPQAPRVDLEAWIDRMGLTPDKVIIVDVAGDLPFRPVDLIDLSPTEIAQNFTNPAQLVATNAMNLINNNGYHDYSQNPNGKYTYVRIESGQGIGMNPVANHMIGIDGALNKDANGNYYEYYFSVNGVSQGKMGLQNVYTKLFRGDYQ